MLGILRYNYPVINKRRALKTVSVTLFLLLATRLTAIAGDDSFTQAELKNSEYRLVHDNAVAQIKQEFEIKKKALKDIYDRKENAINHEFKRRLGLLGAN